ncbi:murein L,D-transpeptidase catalytic domain family protein [Pseudopedobacter beijingensis]|uniref:Murein L,D-transpeptidase catalytic domain family protein n=1 Tax=Pseudopedobacter beijingensis TaxID=1207056 RepID=A0ABW4IEB0_9SPHI
MKKDLKKLEKISLIYLLPLALLFIISFISWTNVNSHHKQLNTDSTAITTVATQSENPSFDKYLTDIYSSIGLQQVGLTFPVFEKALTGFINLKQEKHLNREKEVLTIIDFSKSSKEKRMWIIDLKNKVMLLNTYVAHGRGSGDDLATRFSNIAESNQSSLGFYVTNETYLGKHGLSLRLDGYDRGVNNLARDRAIVIHGASYVSKNFIDQHGRLGRSQGCPAVPVELTSEIIEIIKGKTCIFINGNNTNNYRSVFLNEEKAENNFLHAINS